MLEIDNLSAFYGNSRALQNVTLEVGDAGFLSVLGRNGVGKTALLRAIVGLMDKTEGSIRLDGEEIAATPTHGRVRHGIGYVPQGRGILPQFTVRENLKLGTFARRNPGDRGVFEDKVFELFPVLKEFLNRRGGNLSGGQQQQLAIARALATKPKVLLLDEPTEGIQPSIIQEMARTLKRIRDQRGLSIVVSEQVLSFALDIADRVLVIENGEIVRDDPRASVDAAQISKYLSV
jgi:urea transport system ATP-binding protein